MAGNEALIQKILDKLEPVSEAAGEGVIDQIRSSLQLLDQFAGDAAGQRLGEMLASVEVAMAGMQNGSNEVALAEADRWGVGHLVRAALEASPRLEMGAAPKTDGAKTPRAFGARSESDQAPNDTPD